MDIDITGLIRESRYGLAAGAVACGFILYFLRLRIGRNRGKEESLRREIYEPLLDQLRIALPSIEKAQTASNLRYFADFTGSGKHERMTRGMRTRFLRFHERLAWLQENARPVGEEVEKAVQIVRTDSLAGRYAQSPMTRNLRVSWIEVVENSAIRSESAGADVTISIEGRAPGEAAKFNSDNVKMPMPAVLSRLRSRLMKEPRISEFVKKRREALGLGRELLSECRIRRTSPYTFFELIREG